MTHLLVKQHSELHLGNVYAGSLFVSSHVTLHKTNTGTANK